MMKKHACKAALIIAVLLTVPLNIAQAEGEANVLQIYVTEQTMTVITDSGLRADSLTCAVSSQSAGIVATGLLSDGDALTRTTILLDVSTSMPSTTRSGIIDILHKLIERKSASEEFKVVVFGNGLNTLHDFSSDRYDLASAIDKIKFEDTQSKIYDAIHNTIPRLLPLDKKATFYRTIVITDGADDTATGITKEELFLKLQNEHYPVDVVAVSRGEAAEDRELSAIVRMSGGRYYSLNPSTDADALAQALGVGDYFYFEAIVPASLLDGTTRQVDISDGTYTTSLDVKFPVFNVPGGDTPTPTENDPPASETPESLTTPELTSPQPPVETADPISSTTTLFGDYTIVIYIGAGVALVIVAAVIIAVVVVRRKKKKEVLLLESGITISGGKDAIYRGKTEFIGDMDYTDSQFTIKLSALNNPSKTWTLPVTGDLLIGRAEHCPVQLDDMSVSREQCKIAVQGSGLVVFHLGSSNKTSLNGSNVAGSSPLQSGDTLKFGRESLRIDYIQSTGAPVLVSNQPPNVRKGQTESIF